MEVRLGSEEEQSKWYNSWCEHYTGELDMNEPMLRHEVFIGAVNGKDVCAVGVAPTTLHGVVKFAVCAEYVIVLPEEQGKGYCKSILQHLDTPLLYVADCKDNDETFNKCGYTTTLTRSLYTDNDGFVSYRRYLINNTFKNDLDKTVGILNCYKVDHEWKDKMFPIGSFVVPRRVSNDYKPL